MKGRTLTKNSGKKTTVELDGDDSSDEEDNSEISTTKLFLTPEEVKELPKYIRTVDPKGFSASAFVIGVNQLYSAEVNQKYYQKKSELPKSRLMNPEQIVAIVTELTLSLINDAFLQATAQSAMNDVILKKFLNDYKIWIDKQIAQLCENKRALLKQLNSESAVNTVQKFVDIISSAAIKFITEYKGAITIENPEPFKYRDFRENVYSHIEKYFLNKKLIDGETLKFIPIKNRPKIKKYKDAVSNKLVSYFQNTTAAQKVTTYFDIDNTEGKKRVDTITKEMIKSEFNSGEESCIEKVGDSGYRFKSNTKEIPEDNDYLDTLFSDDDELLKKYLPYTKARFKQEMLSHVKSTLTADAFVEKIQDIKEKFKIERGVPGQFTYKSSNFIEFYANIRLSMRIQTRRIRFNSDNHFDSQREYNAAWQFGDINYDVMEGQAISKNGARSDAVKNLGSYKDIYKSLIKFDATQMKGLATCIVEADIFSQTKLSARFAALKISSEQEFAYRDILLNLVYLVLGCEVQRNPAALVSNMLMLKLISEGKMSWNSAINSGKSEIVALGGGGSMPMSMGAYSSDDKSIKSNVVKCARTLQQHYGLFSAKAWSYQGEATDDKIHITELVKRESSLSQKWFKERKLSEFNRKFKAKKINFAVSSIILK